MMDDRLTRCPYCSSSFTITEFELQKAFGVARCGRCKKIFNASFHLFTPEGELISPQTPTDSSTPEAQRQARKKAAPQAAAGKKTAAKIKAGAASNTTSAVQSPPQTRQVQQVSPDAKQSQAQPKQEAAISTKAKAKTARQPSSQPGEQASEKPQPSQTALTAAREDELSTLDEHLHLSAESDAHTPGKPHKAPRPYWIPATASAALVVLLALLLWSNTRALSQSPALAGYAEAICELTTCEHFLPSDFSHLQATQTEVIQKDSEVYADLLLYNPGETPIPFPALLIQLRSKAGKSLAEHLYQPSQYLKGKPFADQILPPELPVALSLPLPADTDTGLQSRFSIRYLPPSTP